MKKYYAALGIVALFISQPALALDPSEFATLKDTVREICLHPDRTGDYLKTEGEATVGAEVLFKIIKGGLSGKLDYEKWRGISITADKYKTDPRECAIKITEILLPAIIASSKEQGRGDVYQSSSGPKSPPIKDNSGTINIK